MRTKTFLVSLLTVLTACTAAAQSNFIANGIQWHDQEGRPVSAHGANIIREGDRYWLFGEYKTDSANVFNGFSCYSSTDLCSWRFESIALAVRSDADSSDWRMGPQTVGERPKVLRCPLTGEYVMLMHSDDMRYKSPATCYATSKTIDGPYQFQGPILYKGKHIKRWDIGSFVDRDGQAYLLTNHGGIYRLAPDFHSLDSCMTDGVKGTGESPCMLHVGDTYYWLSSHTTSWERNDNMYFTSKSLSGPWTAQGEFAPKGTLTWNSQCSFVLDLNGQPMYMGDRWSFPRQQQAATYVWLPMQVKDGTVSIPEYHQLWNPATRRHVELTTRTISGSWTGRKPGDETKVKFKGGQVVIYGETNDHSAYAEVTITDRRGHRVVDTSIDFYSAVAASDVRYISPSLPEGDYTLTIRVSEMKPNWSDKRRSDYGSQGYEVKVTKVGILSDSRYDFDMTKPQPAYTDSLGYGYDRGTKAVSKKQNAPMFFSAKVPEGDYKVTVTLGSKSYAGVTAVRSETRRMAVERMATKKGEQRNVVFNVNVRTPYIDGEKTVGLQNREKVDWGWDDRLTLEFNGEAPAVSRIRIEPNQPERKIWLCGNSTVTDQDGEPYTSWGQILPYWFDERVSVENIAMSGLRTTSFIQQNRLEKMKREVKPDDYVLIEFGHNDEKDRKPGSGAWYNFSTNLKQFIDELRPLGVRIILATPTERRTFRDGKVVPSHGDYPAAIRAIAEREHLPLIDLTPATTTLYEEFGEEGSRQLLVYYPAGSYPGQSKELKDDTHANAFGAYEISKLVVMGMKELGIDLVNYLRTGWQDFSPSRPDDPQQLYWPYTPSMQTEKPAGN